MTGQNSNGNYKGKEYIMNTIQMKATMAVFFLLFLALGVNIANNVYQIYVCEAEYKKRCTMKAVPKDDIAVLIKLYDNLDETEFKVLEEMVEKK